jgi:hemerythrin
VLGWRGNFRGYNTGIKVKTDMIEWHSKYELGIEDIDFQHHFFLNLINRLANELRQSDNLERQNALISELSAYARFHFISEENIMFAAGYPDFIEHKNLHFELLDQLSSRTNRLAIQKSDTAGVDIIDFLIDWFLHHTSTIDRVFADWMRKEQGA